MTSVITLLSGTVYSLDEGGFNKEGYMKYLFFILISILLVVSAMADDLQPDPMNYAVQTWQSFWETNSIEPANHVVWKLYVFRAIPQRQNPNGILSYLVTGLTPYPKNSYYVGLKIDILYNYLKNTPKRGDVIVVSGQVVTRRDYLLDLGNKEVPIKMLTMNLDGAAYTQEHFNPAATPTDSTTVVVPPTPTPNP